MSDLGALSFYLDIKVKQGTDGITLSQSAYATRILNNAGMTSCNPVHVPMEPRFKLSKESSAPAADATEYCSIVGSLRYVIHTRPDIAFAVGFVSRFMERPTEEDMAAVKRILRYIADTINYGCFYERNAKEAQLISYSDSDMAEDLDTCKSTTGVIFLLGSSAISR